MNVQDTHFYEEFYSFASSYKFKTIEQVQADENIKFSLFLQKRAQLVGRLLPYQPVLFYEIIPDALLNEL